MGYYLAADDVTITPVGAGRRYSLNGDLHAVKAEEDVTVCGLADRSLFPETPWPPNAPGSAVCARCSRITDDVPEIEIMDKPAGWPGGPRERR